MQFLTRSNTNCTNGLGIFEEKSRGYGDDKNGHDSNACTREDISGSRITGCDSIGKILERLGQIERDYVSYLNEEKKQAKSKLEEIDKPEYSLKTAIEQISSEVSNLITNE